MCRKPALKGGDKNSASSVLALRKNELYEAAIFRVISQWFHTNSCELQEITKIPRNLSSADNDINFHQAFIIKADEPIWAVYGLNFYGQKSKASRKAVNLVCRDKINIDNIEAKKYYADQKPQRYK